MNKISILFFCFLVGLISCKQSGEREMVLFGERFLSGHDDLIQEYQQATLKTNYGEITIEFYGDESPVTANNFLNLVKQGFYDKTSFHRVIKGFMIQGGDPNSRDKEISMHGRGGPDYKFKDEINHHKLERGSCAMANAGPNTNGSQFFIVTAKAAPWLDGAHTNFGRVVAGMDVVDKIEHVAVDANDHPLTDVVINTIELKPRTKEAY